MVLQSANAIFSIVLLSIVISIVVLQSASLHDFDKDMQQKKKQTAKRPNLTIDLKDY